MWRGGLLLGVMLAARALADTWYLSPTGDDGAAGTRDAPLQSIANTALNRAVPGDTLVLLDGVYAPITVSCIAGVPAGSAQKPFLVKADHERHATVQSDGQTPTLQVLGCAHWIFEGLDLRSVEAPNASQTHSSALFSLTADVTLRRSVLSVSNRQVSDDELLLLDRTVRSVIEDCELYTFHSVAVRVSGGTGDVFRRDYFRSRDYATAGPPTSLALAPCDSCLVENCISEGNGAFVYLPGGTTPPPLHNRVVGSISLADQVGVLASALTGPLNAPSDIAVTDFVAIQPGTAAIESFGAEALRFAQCTSLGGSDGFSDEVTKTDGGGGARNDAQSFDGLDSLVVGARFAGFYIAETLDGGLAFTNAWDNGFDYIPQPGPDAGTQLNEDPQLGACIVFIPASSPMKGAGQGGADIGANILFRSVDAGLTAEPLWDRSTGAFPCGAQIAGLNDVPDASCFDVHVRLRTNDPLCPLPTATPDAGAPDAGAPDAGAPDAGTPDAGAPDAGAGPISAYGLRCASAPGTWPWVWLAAWVLRRRRLRSSS